MNTAKIAALYPYFVDMLRHLGTGRSLESMLAVRLLADSLGQLDARHYSVHLRDQDNPVQYFNEAGLLTEDHLTEHVSARVFDWVLAQMPARPQYTSDLEGWRAEHAAHLAAKAGWLATAHAYTPTPSGLPGQLPSVSTPPQPSVYQTWTGSAAELAVLLRGVRALETKRRKHYRRLLVQLWHYHCQQQEAAAAAARQVRQEAEHQLQQAQVADEQAMAPALCCLTMPAAEYDRRTDAAEDLAEAKNIEYNQPNGRYGREILWHPLFPAEYVAGLSGAPLHEIARRQAQVADWANQGRALDYYDHAYLADVLREALASTPTQVAALRLNRALTWVEQAAAALLASEQPAQAAASQVAARHLAAVLPAQETYAHAQPHELAQAA